MKQDVLIIKLNYKIPIRIDKIISEYNNKEFAHFLMEGYCGFSFNKGYKVGLFSNTIRYVFKLDKKQKYYWKQLLKKKRLRDKK